MNVDALIWISEQLLNRQLLPLERFVLHQSWSKQTYAQMAQASSYGAEYVKHVGFKLWLELSTALGETVSKKNLHLVFTDARFTAQMQPEVSVQSQRVEEDRSSEKPQLPDVVDEEAQAEEGAATEKLTMPSGPVKLGSILYVQRSPVEETAQQEICFSGCLLRIKSPRQTGKSSLLNRLLAFSKTKGYRPVKLNFQEVDADTFSSLERLLRWFCANLSLQLGLPSQVERQWDPDMGSKVNCKLYLERYVFPEIVEPIVLGIDELNRVFEYPSIAQDFLPMLRVWHERSRDSSTWGNLRLVLVHATDFYVPLKISQSPFNVGLAITLPPFTLVQLKELARRYGLGALLHRSDMKQLNSLHHLINGHPYLAGLAFYALRQQHVSLHNILETATKPTGIYRQHLQQCLATLRSDPDLTDTYYQVVSSRQGAAMDAISAYRLERLGLVKFEEGLVQPSCELYRQYFCEQLG